MIILTAGHTGPNSGAQSATTQFDEGAENIWLRNRIAEILTNRYGLVVLMDDDTVSLKLLTKALSEDILHTEFFHQRLKDRWFTDNTEDALTPSAPLVLLKQGDNIASLTYSSPVLGVHLDGSTAIQKTDSLERFAKPENLEGEETFLIDLHFNAHGNPQARGTETIVADDATELELRMASRLAHATADSLEIPLRGIKSESETPHHRLAMLHLTPQSIILEVCFCTSPEDVEAYRKNREKLAAELAWAIAELIE